MIFNPKYMPSQRLTLKVIKFTFESQERFTTFGNPILAETMPHLKAVLEKWSIQLSKPLSTSSPTHLQDWTTGLNIATQISFDTQIPAPKSNRLKERTSGTEKGGDLLSILSANALKPNPAVTDKEPKRFDLSPQVPRAGQPFNRVEESGTVARSTSSLAESSILLDTEAVEISPDGLRNPYSRRSKSGSDSPINIQITNMGSPALETVQRSIPEDGEDGLVTFRSTQDRGLSRESIHLSKDSGGSINHIQASPSRPVVLKALKNGEILKIASSLEAKANGLHDQSFPEFQQTQQPGIPKFEAPQIISSTFDRACSPALEDSEKENAQDSFTSPSRKVASQREQIIPVNRFNFLHHDLNMNSFDGMKRVPRSYARIPEAQNALLERTDSWIQSETGSDVLYANIPAGVLEDLRSFMANKQGETPETQIESNFMNLNASQKNTDPCDTKTSGHHNKDPWLENKYVSGFDEEMSDGTGHELDSEIEDLNRNLEEQEQPMLPRNACAPIGSTVGTDHIRDKTYDDSDDDADAISWESSPIRDPHVEDELNEGSQLHNESPIRTILKPKVNFRGNFPSSCPNSDDELPLDVPHVIGEEVDEKDNQVLNDPNGSREIPSTLPHIYSLVQVKRTPHQNQRLSETQTNNEKHIGRKSLTSNGVKESHVSSDPFIPATFKEGSSRVLALLKESTSNGRSQVYDLAKSTTQDQDLSWDTVDGLEDDSYEFLASQQLYDEIAGSQLPVSIHSSTPWAPSETQLPLASSEFEGHPTLEKIVAENPVDISLSILETPLRRGISNEASPTRCSQFMIQDVDATAATGPSAISDVQIAPGKIRKRNRLAMMDFSEDPNEEDSLKDINEMLRADRYKYKPASDSQSPQSGEESSHPTEPTSAQQTSREILDSSESSGKSLIGGDLVSMLEKSNPEAHSGISSQQPYAMNKLTTAAEESSSADQDPMDLEHSVMKPELDTDIVSIPTVDEHGSPVLLSKTNGELEPSLSEPTARVPSPTNQHRSEFLSVNSTAYNKFVSVYGKNYAESQQHQTQYIGSQNQFTWALVYLNHLSQGRNKRFLKRNLWDDFIRVLAADFQDYVRKATRLRAEDPTVEVLVGIEFYNDRDEDVKFKEMVITPDNLQDALSSLDQEEVMRVSEAFGAPSKNFSSGSSSQNSRASTPFTSGWCHTIVKPKPSIPYSRSYVSSKATDFPCLSSQQKVDINIPRTTTRKPFFETHSQMQHMHSEDQITKQADQDKDDEVDEQNGQGIQVLASTTHHPISSYKSESLPRQQTAATPAVPSSSPQKNDSKCLINSRLLLISLQSNLNNCRSFAK